MTSSNKPRAKRPIMGYPTGWFLAVIDEPEMAAEAADALRSAGVPAERVRVLVGPEGRVGLSQLGSGRGRLARIVRVVQFTTMDQMPDFAAYEAALDEGRALVAVKVPRRPDLLAARAVLARFGAHFENYFGRFITEEFSRWRGREPDLPDSLRR